MDAERRNTQKDESIQCVLVIFCPLIWRRIPNSTILSKLTEGFSPEAFLRVSTPNPCSMRLILGKILEEGLGRVIGLSASNMTPLYSICLTVLHCAAFMILGFHILFHHVWLHPWFWIALVLVKMGVLRGRLVRWLQICYPTNENGSSCARVA